MANIVFPSRNWKEEKVSLITQEQLLPLNYDAAVIISQSKFRQKQWVTLHYALHRQGDAVRHVSSNEWAVFKLIQISMMVFISKITSLASNNSFHFHLYILN